MKTEYLKRLSDTVKEATNFLNSLAEGRIIQLATDEELQEDDDLLYNLPTASRVDKNSMYDEYGVVAVQKTDGKILFTLEGRGEVAGVKITIDLSEGYYEISDTAMCHIIDTISEELNK